MNERVGLMSANRRAALVYGWAVGGVAAILLEAIVRLGTIALRTLARPLSAPEWAAFGVLGGALVYGEGWRVLHGRFAPRVVTRARALARREASAARIALAPLYALALLGADRGAVAREWLTVALIVTAAVAVRALPGPWRGLVDGGVSLALACGLASLLVRALACGREDAAARERADAAELPRLAA
jgi:hypothetical protein